MADGDDIVLALLSHVLSRQGHCVDVAASAVEAEEHLAAKVHDAILIDARLPGGGSDWLRRCVTDPERRLIVLASRDLGNEVPSCAVLQKPIEFNLLIETVEACLNDVE